MNNSWAAPDDYRQQPLGFLLQCQDVAADLFQRSQRMANYAVRQVLAGRRVGGSLNINDVTSPYAQAACGLVVNRLDEYDSDSGVWREALVEDRRATPADTAAARLDVAEWLLSLSARHRRIAETLAMGETTGEVARQFGLSTARISQFRVQLRNSWEQFQAGARGC